MPHNHQQLPKPIDDAEINFWPAFRKAFFPKELLPDRVVLEFDEL